MNDTFPPSWNPQLNLPLSSKQHPGSVRLACGWCGLRVKGSIAYVADYTPVDKAFRCCGQRALSLQGPRLQNTYLHPLQVPFKLSWSFVLYSPAGLCCNSAALVAHFVSPSHSLNCVPNKRTANLEKVNCSSLTCVSFKLICTMNNYLSGKTFIYNSQAFP